MAFTAATAAVVIRERCSCGARFETDEPDAIRLVREWRRKHTCIDPEPEVQAMGGGNAQVEQPIGFAINGLDYPARKHDPWEDE